ncbi:hypothetical protein C8A05DRAFT_39435 [Staphylotrichum tortipilum]|uniref:SMODS and SLOG-associating 2TM effector domain-containing protein n=1 Tax=Staphylotrichum tortipilum TaxID=2831512 RepID=A0AAN6MA70_9PEZI|nr:hypothetical protein C8A05DRAFT_39435 [Staphylotrichum longicolle]
MASSSKDTSQQGVPPANGDHHPSDTTSSFYKSERKSSIPIPPGDPIIPPLLNPGNPPPPISPKPPLGEPHQPSPPPPSQPQPQPGDLSARHRFLSPTEWARVAHGIGAIREGDEHQVVHPTCWYWPSRGLPDGLYRDVVLQRIKYSLSFQLLNMLHWTLMVLQVMVGAILTALGSLPMREATPITALAAVNTVGAGLIGLMHNSGLPDRYRMDKAQFILVEDYLKEVLDTGIVEAHQTVEDVLDECYSRFHTARATVLSNKPEVYTSSPTTGKNNAMICPDPSAHARLPPQ